jgi:hypothetical protein
VTEVVRDTGQPWEVVLDQLDSRRLASLRRSWLTAPPIHRVVAAIAGIKPQTGKPPQVISTREEAEMMMAATGGKIPGVGSM